MCAKLSSFAIRKPDVAPYRVTELSVRCRTACLAIICTGVLVNALGLWCGRGYVFALPVQSSVAAKPADLPAKPSPSHQPGQSSSSSLSEIVVQGSRTDQRVSRWPGAIHVLSGEDLAFIRHQHIAEALVRAPGVWISRGNGQEHLSAIRSPVLTGAGACGAFLMAEDGIALRAAGFCNVNQLLEAGSEFVGGTGSAIEVLAGPQSVLYGSNAMHGVINVVSPSPGDHPGWTSAIEVGSNDYYRSDIGLVIDHGYMGFSGVRDTGYKDAAGFDQQKLKFRYDWAIGHLTAVTVASMTNLNQETAGFITGEHAYRDSARKRENPNPEAYRDVRSQRLHTRFEYAEDDVTHWVITPYVRNTEMQFLMHFVPWQPVENNSHWSAGWQSGVQHRLNQQLTMHLGLDGEYTQGDLQEVQSQAFSSSIPAGVHYDYTVAAQVLAPFAQVQWQVSEATQVSAGVRQEWLSYDYDNRAGGASACAQGVVICRFSRPDDNTDSFSNASWQLGGVHEFTARHSVFVNLARGYRAPQTTELYRLQQGQKSADLDSETLDSVELGVRGSAKSVGYSLAVYRMAKDHVIFEDAERRNISGASTSHRGIDMAISWTPSESWYLNVNASYARHRYASTDHSAGAGNALDIRGNDIDTAPRHMGSAQLGRYFAPESRVELEWVHLGGYYTDPENEHSYPGHNLLNFRINWQFERQWQVGLRVVNIADRDYADRADFGFGQDRYFVGMPRSIFVELLRITL